MIQLKETDFLWKMYKRYYKEESFRYKDEGGCPHPKSLCNFFWKSMGGVWKTLFWDVHVLFFAPFLIAATYGASIWAQSKSTEPPTFEGVATGILFFVLFITTGLHIMGRAIGWCVKHGKEWLILLAIMAVVFSAFSAILGQVYSDTLTWWSVLAGAGTLIGILVVLIGGIYLLNKDYECQTEKVIKGYFRAVKERVCPRIFVPGETPPEKSNEVDSERSIDKS